MIFLVVEPPWDLKGTRCAAAHSMERGDNQSLKATRFGDLRRNTLSWCRRTRISACKAARDRNNPTTAHQINLQRSAIAIDYYRFAGNRQPYWVCNAERAMEWAERALRVSPN